MNPNDEHDSIPIPRIVHIHIPKTAGTAVRIALEKLDPSRTRLFPHYEERKFRDVNPHEYDLFSGHIGYATASSLGGPIITMLREPVDRFASVYYFWRELWEKGVERSLNTNLASAYTLEEFVKIRDEPTLIEEFHNRMTWQLAHGSTIEHRRELRREGLTEDNVLLRAVQNLTSFAVVGMQEFPGEFEHGLKHAFGIDVKIGRINLTQTRTPINRLSVSVRRSIQEWLYADIELYHAALKLGSQRDSSPLGA